MLVNQSGKALKLAFNILILPVFKDLFQNEIIFIHPDFTAHLGCTINGKLTEKYEHSPSVCDELVIVLIVCL